MHRGLVSNGVGGGWGGVICCPLFPVDVDFFWNGLRIQKYEVFDEVLLQFVVSIWNQIENCMAFPDGIFEKVSITSTFRNVTFHFNM